MKRIRNIAISMMLIAGTMAFGQSTEKSVDQPVMKGAPQVLIFTNYRYSNTDGKSLNQFQISRAYFGYKYQFSTNWSSAITFDVGDPGKIGAVISKYQMSAYLKQAFVQYQNEGLKVNFGMTNTLMYNVQQGFWGHRYAMKSFQDEHNFEASADLGATVQYKFNDIVSVDGAITNGEGYTKVEADSVLRFGLGVTLTPVKGLTARLYYDTYNKWGANQETFSTFLGYKMDKFYVAGEYNIQKNSLNAGMAHKNCDLSGVSFYGNYDLKQMGIFARYDNLWSNKVDGASTAWNEGNKDADGSTYVLGVEFNPVKGVKIAPNYRYFDPSKKDAKGTNYIYLSLQIKI